MQVRVVVRPQSESHQPIGHRARRGRRSGFALVGVTALVVTFLADAGPASGQVPSSSADYGGYATGTVAHAHALQAGDTRVVNADVAFSSAAADSKGLSSELLNEVERVVSPASAATRAYGRGISLDVGIAQGPSDVGQIALPAVVEAAAPPSTVMATEDLLSENVADLAYAELLRAQAQSAWNANTCALGSDLGFGQSRVARVQLLDLDADSATEELDAPLLASDAPDPTRAVSQSTSRVRLVPQVDRNGQVEGDAVGVMSETRMTVAPITINLGGQAVYTVEILGEWVLRAVATGRSGWVQYGPGTVSPETPVLRVIDQVAKEVTNIVTFQELLPGLPLLGPEGLVIPIEELGIEIALGEAPRAIGGAAGSAVTETATRASAAVDVARIRLLDLPEQFGTVADVRVGHMEVDARAPAGGITCEVPISKAANPQSVNPGQEFTYTITVENPFACALTDVRVVDRISATPGVTYSIVSTSDGGTVSGDTVTWDDVGPIPPGQAKAVTIKMKVADTSASGVISDVAEAQGACALADAGGSTKVDVPVRGQAKIDLPTVGAGAPAPGGSQVLGVQATQGQGGELPKTGGVTGGAALALMAAGALVRRLRT